MNSILSQLELSSDSHIDGLVQISEKIPADIPLAEKRIVYETLKISKYIDSIFFRRFTKDDVRTSQAVAYIIDNSSRKLSQQTLARLHHTLWLNGTVPLLYIDNDDRVDIFSCVMEAVSDKIEKWEYDPLYTILSSAQNIDDELKRFSAIRLSDGTFWEDERNKDCINLKKSAHNVLLEKIKQADREIDGENNPVARRLLLLTLLIKYLEDRGVFNAAKNFFSKYVDGANSFYHVLKHGKAENILNLFDELEKKFNGDIFQIKRKTEERITQGVIKKIANIVRADIDSSNQLYFWELYNFEHIPVEVISHIYQYFTGKRQGSVFTPVLLVNLMLDQVMPLETIKGDEKVFDPTCGSGIFLVSAFRRLVYIQKQKDLKWVTPQNLIDLLHDTIFGVELNSEAAYITSFSLALAVCDALKPDIIWHKLQFKKTIDKNIFVGDFAEKGDDALKACKQKNGFDIILGNPPFIERLTPAMVKNLTENNKTIVANQMAYYILISSTQKYLSESGKICMIQHYGFLYNSNTAPMRCDFFKQFSVEKILDFISISGLFYKAGTKAMAVQANKNKPKNNSIITHLTFRRTITANDKIFFELDHYDYHTVLQDEASDENYSWKANLLGGGRLAQLTKRLEKMTSIEEYISKRRWHKQVGYIVGNKINEGDFLFNQPLLVPEALTSNGINEILLDRVRYSKFERPRSEDIYQSPLMIIEARDALNSGFWNNGFLAYTSEYIGIKVQPNEKNELEVFYEWFKNNRNILRSCLHLIGGRMLAARSTASQNADIMKLPYPESSEFDFVPWEVELLNDVLDYMSEYVRVGQDSKLLLNEAADQDLQNYSETFLRLMNKMFPDLKGCKKLKENGFILIAFSFSGKNNILSELNDTGWLKKISSLPVEKEKNDVLRTKRVVRIYIGDVLIIIKPSKLRYWIRSTAIRDVDDVLLAILKEGK